MKRFALLATTLLASPAFAQGASAPTDHYHVEQPEEIIISAPYVRDLNILAGRSVLTGSDLVRDMRPQIGDTLTRLPGVSATSFSPGASRPVLRGFQGERVRVLTDGIGSIDVSNTSADHAVTIDPLTAERIEVLHGPAALLFGSQAIGGAVNVLDRRIPRTIPDDLYHLDAVASYGSAADERSIGAGLDLPAADGLVFHFDGSYRKTDDLRTGGYILTPEWRAEQLHVAEHEREEGHIEEAEEAEALAASRGRLPNSATETYTLGAGLAWIGSRGNIGASVTYYNSDYGVPARPGTAHHHHEEEGEEHDHDHEGEEGHAHEHGDVTIGLEQVRADLRGELNLDSSAFEALRVRAGYADYTHTEFEGSEVGTVFDTQGAEGRVELVQADRNGWRGVTGAQVFHRDFQAVGAEAFVPANETTQYGLFTLQEVRLGESGFEIEGSGRFEHTDVSSDPLGIDRDFDAFSAAVGLSYDLSRYLKFGATVSRSERAPSAEELFSNGPHIATQAFEIGDPDLVKEKSWGGELYARYSNADHQLSASIFANDFSDFIFESATGEEEDELPVFQYLQRDARYYGFELSGSTTVARSGAWKFVADGVADYVRANVKDGGGAVPRIPPLRLLGGIEAQSASLDGRVEVEWTADQDRIAELETPTEGFTLVNASVAWRPWGRANPTSIILSANNIFDVEARRHASFTKDFAPLAGRDIRVSARISL